MSDLRKAAEMALEALDELKEQVTQRGATLEHWDSYYEKQYYALEALRQALAQPTWVGLTDEEIHEIMARRWWDWEDSFDVEGFSRAIEAKLKEKNT